MPYSPDDYILVAIYIPDNELFMKEYHQLFPKGSRWNTRQNVLICGHWKENIVDGETASICEFTRPRKQLHLLILFIAYNILYHRVNKNFKAVNHD